MYSKIHRTGGERDRVLYLSRLREFSPFVTRNRGCFTSHRGGGGFHFQKALDIGDTVTGQHQQSRQRALVLKCMSTVTKIGALGEITALKKKPDGKVYPYNSENGPAYFE